MAEGIEESLEHSNQGSIHQGTKILLTTLQTTSGSTLMYPLTTGDDLPADPPHLMASPTFRTPAIHWPAPCVCPKGGKCSNF